MWPAVTLAFASVLSYPDEGSEPMGRAGAWVARASDPIALARNPAGLAGQPARMSGGWDLAIRHACFETVCDTSDPFPIGFFTLTFPISPRFSVGAGIVTPHGIGRAEWPMFVGTQPAPQRYLLLESTTLFALPTIGAAWEIVPHSIRVGASFGWGLASVRSSAAAATSAGDYKVTILARDLFIPRATLGVHARGNEFVEFGASFMASAPFSGSGEATTEANGFTERAARGDVSKIAHGWVDDAELEVAIPAEASLGVRLRLPRGHGRRGDPIDTELADVELDASWSHDAAIDRYDVRVIEGVRVERRFRDVVGFRLGGDVNVVPGALAIRAGTFLTPRSGVPGATGLETMSGTRFGISAGMTARVEGRFDLSAAYLHVFIDDVGPLRDGLDVMHLGMAYRF